MEQKKNPKNLSEIVEVLANNKTTIEKALNHSISSIFVDEMQGRTLDKEKGIRIRFKNDNPNGSLENLYVIEKIVHRQIDWYYISPDFLFIQFV